LVDDGLLEAGFARRTGRDGPGAGRPAKLYRPGARELAVTLPQRRYELAGQLMARAITHARGEGRPVAEALPRAARGPGRGRAGAPRARGAAGWGAWRWAGPGAARPRGRCGPPPGAFSTMRAMRPAATRPG